MKIISSLFATLILLTPALSLATTSDPVQEAVAALNEYRAKQQSAQVQDVDLAYAMRKALLISNLLLDQNGKLNTSLCQSIKTHFISDQPEEYEVNIAHVLDQLDASWQSLFDSIKKPQDLNGNANLLLRAMFGLSDPSQVQDNHAKQAALAALLAPYNQGPVGDCFAVAGLLRDHDEYYHHTFEDFANIVVSGHITRFVGTKPDDFFFLPILADDDRSNTLTIDASGNIAGSNLALLDAPGFVTACAVMQQEPASHLQQNVLSILFQGTPQGTCSVTPSQVIEACAQAIAATHPNLDAKILALRGKYAFSSLTNNPVLRATECAFAAMAEDRDDPDSTRQNVNDCVEQAMKQAWHSLGEEAEGFHKLFSTIFNASYRFVYNPDIVLPQVAADGSSTDGGFQLYKRKAQGMGIRVATPQEFGHLVIDSITATANQLGSSPQTQKIADSLKSFVNSPSFLRDALWAYDDANKKEAHPVENYQKLSRTPMQSCDGDDPYEVDDIDTGHAFEKDVQTFTPNTTKDLLTWCLTLAKTAPKGLLPMNTPDHAFNFTPADADLTAFVKTGESPEHWIRQVLCVPGMKVSTRIMDAKTQTALVQSMQDQVSQALSDMSGYHNLVATLAEKPLSVQKYTQGLIDGINNLLNSNDAQSHQVALAVDEALIQALPADDRSLLEHTCVLFANTNWNDETKDIYFCAYFNPRTQQVAFGSIDEDKHNLEPMDEQEWVNQQQWDVDLHPYAPAT